jgi:sialic acid synthase SpsE
MAEAGNNHNGRLDLAFDLIDAAAEAGCDAVKFQKRNPQELLSRGAFRAPYKVPGRSFGDTYGEHREHVELSHKEFRELNAHAARRNILMLASAWDESSANFVAGLEPAAFKIGSPDLTNTRLCQQVAGFGRPVLLSTGMAELAEVDVAVAAIRERNPELVLLHCVSIYPTPPERARLNQIATLRTRHRLPVGYSSHDLGTHLPLAAVALGACVIEKHLTLDRSLPGSDHAISLEPAEFAEMVTQIREVRSASPSEGRPLFEEERAVRRKLAKSVVSRVEIARGTRIVSEMLTCKSPGTGISAARLDEVVGRVAARDIAPDETMSEDDLESLD